MLRLAVGLVDIPERAEEIVQDAFEKTLIAWGRLREPGAYLRTVDDEWVIAGYFELGVEGYPAPDLSDERFTTPDGAVLPIATATANGFAWMVIRVPPGVNTIFPDVMGEIGGTSRASRPVVVGTLG